MSLKLYGHLVSQPSRAVAWILKLKGIDYELIETMPASESTKTPEFLSMNPNGFVPVLQDGDFSLFEGNAIMTYLADKFQWDDLYPTEPKARAKVNEYLHWHHTNARLGTPKIVIPYVHKALGAATDEDLENIKHQDQIIGKFVRLIEIFLADSPYLAKSSHVTLADIACYCELDQLEAMGIFDFTPFPKTADWLKRMKDVPFHDEIHETINEFLTKFQLKPVAVNEH